jgi:hypothetical protein
MLDSNEVNQHKPLEKKLPNCRRRRLLDFRPEKCIRPHLLFFYLRSHSFGNLGVIGIVAMGGTKDEDTASRLATP